MKLLAALLPLIILTSVIADDKHWTLVGRTEGGAELLVDASSIKDVDGHQRVAIELFNYRDEGARKRSQVSGTLYDCEEHCKRDQFISTHDAY